MSDIWFMVIGFALANGGFVVGWLLCERKWKQAFPIKEEG